MFRDLALKLVYRSVVLADRRAAGRGEEFWISARTNVLLGQLEYKNRVEARLKALDCRIAGRTMVGRPPRIGVSGFGYSYQQGATRGEIFVEFVDLSNGKFRVHAFCVEFPLR